MHQAIQGAIPLTRLIGTVQCTRTFSAVTQEKEGQDSRYKNIYIVPKPTPKRGGLIQVQYIHAAYIKGNITFTMRGNAGGENGTMRDKKMPGFG